MTTSLLPKTTSDFTDPQYWRRFFAGRKTPFEWYGDYEVLGPVIEKYIKAQDNIIQLGCGNSRLASQMYDSGFRNVHSVDLDSAVIEDQTVKNRARTGLTFAVDDVTQLQSEDDSYNVVLDKGTLDALLPPGADLAQTEAVESMFKQIRRVLIPGGRYLIITLAQEHIIRCWMEHFSNTRQFLLRAHKVENRASGFPMPVFILIATKLRVPMPTAMPTELLRAGDEKPDRISNGDDFRTSILAEQEFSRFVHLTSGKLESEVSIDIEAKTGGKRFRIFILDDPKVKTYKSYAVFVTPIGRDGDWIFTTEKGRKSLLSQTQKDRLAVITLFRDQKYDSLEAVKDELGALMTKFDPRTDSSHIDFLTVGGVDVRRTVATGHSEINGDWAVEDVMIKDQEYRRLVFLTSQNLVQSEAALRSTKNKKGQKVVDLDRLSCEHHTQMLASLTLLPTKPLNKPDQAHLKVAVLGLGGGSLAAYILRHLPQSVVAGVELDPEVVRVSTNWFSFPADDKRMLVKTMDAKVYLEERAATEAKDKLDALLVDLAGSMHEDGLSCPPAIFITKPVLENMKKSLKPTGVLALNLVTRDEEVAVIARKRVGEVFGTMLHIASDDEVNEVLLCPSVELEMTDFHKMSRMMRKDLPWVAEIAKYVAKMQIVKL